MRLRTLGPLFVVSTLFGCPDEPKDPQPPPLPWQTGDSGPRATAAMHEMGSHTPTVAVTPCTIPWAGLEPCAADYYVYASGSAPDSMLGLKKAANEARVTFAKLVRKTGDPSTILQGVEILDSTICKDEVRVLARMPRGKLQVRDCDVMTILTEAPVPDGCPDWVRKVIKLDGDQKISVASARGVKNKDLARSTAANRARTQLWELASITVSINPNGHSISSSGNGVLTEGEIEYAECDDAVWAKLTVY